MLIGRRGLLRTMRIYTRTGDKGSTGLYSGERLPKNHFVFEALGANDELTSNLGVAIEHCKSTEKLNELVEKLVTVQSRIQDLNSHIATTNTAQSERFGTNVISAQVAYHVESTRFDRDGKHTDQLEQWI